MSCYCLSKRCQQQRGVALAMLMWMLAALSLLVSGMVYQSRSDVQLTRLHLDQASARAAATGAGHLLLRDMLQARSEGLYAGRAIFTGEYVLNELNISARAIPLSGLIDLNKASFGLLRDLFNYTGGLPEAESERLAESIVTRRAYAEPDEDELKVHAPFAVIEDLLRIPGMTRLVYDRISRSIHAEPGGQNGIDPFAAPPPVLRTIAHGDESMVDLVMDAQQSDPTSEAQLPTGLNQDYLVVRAANAYCMEIDVRREDGQVLQQRIWAVISTPVVGIRWQFTRLQPMEFIHNAVNEE